VPADASSSGPFRLAGTPVVCFFTAAAHGDQRAVVEQGVPGPGEIPAGLSVAGLRQVHGSAVVNVVRGTLEDGDAALATDHHTCVAVLVADCLPIAIGSPEGVRVAVHAGWRGLVAGVVQKAAWAARDAGASTLVAGLGPCIGPCCYEFSPDELEHVTRVLGARSAAKTTGGDDALDIRAAAHEALESSGVRVDVDVDRCTACNPGWYSARAGDDIARQALYVWRVE
jgi:YfiH family protein